MLQKTNKMVKRKNKKKIKNALIFFGILVLTLIFFITAVQQTQYPAEKTAIETEEGDVVVFTSQPLRFIDRILEVFNLKQQAAFAKTTVNIGETVSMYDTIYPEFNSETVTSVKFVIDKDGKGYATYLTGWKPNFPLPQKISVNFKPTQTGQYIAHTAITACTQPILQIGCKSYMHVSSYFTTEPINVLTVKSASPAVCTKTAYWSSWNTINNINNGRIKERVFNIVNTNCEYETPRTGNTLQQKIVCNKGYIVSGYTSSIATYTGSEYCEQEYIEPPEEPIVEPPEEPIVEPPEEPIVEPPEEPIVEPGVAPPAISNTEKYIKIVIIVGIVIISIMVLLIIIKVLRRGRKKRR